MCDLTNIGNYSGSALQIASAGLNAARTIGGEIQRSNLAEASNQATLANYNAQAAQLGLQQTQINAQASQQQSQLAREAAIERGRLNVTAAEAGVAGASLGRIENTINQRANEASTNIESNRLGRIQQTDTAGLGLRAQAESQLRDEGFNWLGTGLSIAGTALDAASNLKKRKV